LETLKVAIVSDWFYPKIGGIETHIHELALHLLKMGHEPHVITHDYRKYKSKYRDDFPYPVHRFKGLLYSSRLHVSMGWRMLTKINELYKLERFDLTHAHSMYSPMSITTSNISKGIRSTPVVLTNHSLFSWNNMIARSLLPLLRWSIKRVDVFIAVSRIVRRDTLRILREKGSVKPVVIIPNGVDTSFWRPPEPTERSEARKRLGVDSSATVISVVGRFTRRKRIHIVPKIVYKAWRREGGRVELVIVGDGELRGRVEDEARKYMRPPWFKVRVEGFLPRHRLREVYWSSDIFLVPSRMEAFSITALEATATGLPVVGFRGSGVADIVEATGSGVLVFSEDEAVDAIVNLIRNVDTRMAMGEIGVTRVQQIFSWPNVAEKVVETYRAALDSKNDGLFLLYKIWRMIKK